MNPSLDALGGLAAQSIGDGLLRSGVVDVVDPVTAFYAVGDVQRDTAARDSHRTLRLMAEAGAAGTVVSGEIVRLADSLVFQVLVSDLVRNRRIGTFRVPVPEREAPTSGVTALRDQVAGFLAARLDPNLRSLGSDQLPPPRLDAYREFARGLDVFRTGRNSEALAAFLTSSRLDSNFVLPLIWTDYAAEGRMADSLREVRRTLLTRLGPRLSPLDRYGLIHSVYWADPKTPTEALRAAARLAPGSNWAFMFANTRLFRFREAIRIMEGIDRQRGWARGWEPLYNDFGILLHHAGENPRVLDLMREGIRATSSDSRQMRIREQLGFAALGRVAELDRSIGAASGLPYDEMVRQGAATARLAGELRTAGFEDASRRYLARADQWAEANRGRPDSAGYFADKGMVAYYGQHWADARRWLEAYVAAKPGESGLRYYTYIHLMIIAAVEGNRAEAERLADLAVRDGGVPKGSLVLPVLIAAAAVESDRAVELLEESIGNADDWDANHIEHLLHDPALARFRRSAAWRAFANSHP